MANLLQADSRDADKQGLFSRRCSANILSDPRILEHLRVIASRAQNLQEEDDEPEESSSEEEDNEYLRNDIATKISHYNKRVPWDAFHIVQKDLHFEGAVRFYFEEGKQILTKAIRLTNTTQVYDLIPSLLNKFNLHNDASAYALYEVQEEDEICLDDSECPLCNAINARDVPRFVLRLKSSLSASTRVPALRVEPAIPPLSRKNTTSSSSKSLCMDTIEESGSMAQGPDASWVPAGTKEMYKNRLTGLMSSVRRRPMSTGDELDSANSGRRKGRRASNRDANQTHSDLSWHDNAPTVVRIFGGDVLLNSNYKSVRVQPTSTSLEVLQLALNRYGINEPVTDFVLCDAVGKVELDGHEEDAVPTWRTVSTRLMEDHELPYLVLSLWKPAAGLKRRLELVRRGSIRGGFDPTGAGNLGEEVVRLARDAGCISPGSEGPSLAHLLEGGSKPRTALSVPTDVAYLLLLRGYESGHDPLIHRLESEHTLLGGKATSSCDFPPDIALSAPDILPQSCVIARNHLLTGDPAGPDIDALHARWTVSPQLGARVCIDYKTIFEKTEIRPGQILTIGSHYIFLFKDPTTVDEASLNIPMLPQDLGTWTRSSAVAVSSREVDDHVPPALPKSSSDEEHSWEEFLEYLPQALRRQELSSSVRQPLAEISSAVWSAVRESGDLEKLLTQFDRLSDVFRERISDVSRGLNNDELDGRLLSPGEVISLYLPSTSKNVWYMNLTTEVLICLRRVVQVALARTYQRADIQAQLVASAENTLNGLQDVILFTFQFYVCTFTKGLLTLLPPVLTIQPLRTSEEPDDEESMPREMANVLDWLSLAHETLKKQGTHPVMIKTCASYLFVFISGVLTKELCNASNKRRVFNWHRAMNLRAGLNFMEGWAARRDLTLQYTHHMREFVSVVEMLSTSKAQLMKTSWSTLRQTYPSLNVSLLHYILMNYNGRIADSDYPPCWKPVTEDQATIDHSGCSTELTSYPQFVPPSSSLYPDLLEQPSPSVSHEVRPVRQVPTVTVEETGHSKSMECLHGQRSSPNGHAAQHTSSCVIKVVSRSPSPSVVPGAEAMVVSAKWVPYHGGQSPSPSTAQIIRISSVPSVSVVKPRVHVTLTRSSSGVGIGLIDGRTCAVPRPGLYVSTIIPESPADLTGEILVGDRVLEVDGVDISESDLQNATETIRRCGMTISFTLDRPDPEFAHQFTNSTLY